MEFKNLHLIPEVAAVICPPIIVLVWIIEILFVMGCWNEAHYEDRDGGRHFSLKLFLYLVGLTPTLQWMQDLILDGIDLTRWIAWQVFFRPRPRPPDPPVRPVYLLPSPRPQEPARPRNQTPSP